MMYFKRFFALCLLFITAGSLSSSVYGLNASSDFDGFRSFGNTDLGMMLGSDWEPHAMYLHSENNFFMTLEDEDRFLLGGKEYTDYLIVVHQAMLKNKNSGNYGFIYRVQVSPGDWVHNLFRARTVKTKEISSHVQLRTNEYQLINHEPKLEPTNQSGSMGISVNTSGVASLGFNYNWRLEELTIDTSGTSAANRRFGAQFILWDRWTPYTTNDQYYYGLFIFSYTPDYSTCSGQSNYCYVMKRPFVDMEHEISLHSFDRIFTPRRNFTGHYRIGGNLTLGVAKIGFSSTIG